MTDDQVATAVRPLYRSDQAAQMALADDLKTAYAIAQALPKRVQLGWLVEASGGPMFWPLAGRREALAYCADDAEPVALYADVTEHAAHQTAQGD